MDLPIDCITSAAQRMRNDFSSIHIIRSFVWTSGAIFFSYSTVVGGSWNAECAPLRHCMSATRKTAPMRAHAPLCLCMCYRIAVFGSSDFDFDALSTNHNNNIDKMRKKRRQRKQRSIFQVAIIQCRSVDHSINRRSSTTSTIRQTVRSSDRLITHR